MVDHASEYPWSSFQYNGVGREVNLITPHGEYLMLDKNHEKRCKAYRKLFQGHMPDLNIKETREALQKEWILGDDRFKRRIKEKLGVSRSVVGGLEPKSILRANRAVRVCYRHKKAPFISERGFLEFMVPVGGLTSMDGGNP